MAGKKKFDAGSEGGADRAGSLIDVDAIRQLVEVLERSGVTRLSWKRGPERLVLQRGGGPGSSGGPPAGAGPVAPHAAPAPSGPRVSAPEPATPAAAEKPGALVTSPFVGTFYRAAGPDQPVFVEVGSMVKKGQVLCIIEAMKLMNEIEAEVAGKVTEILAENGATVEFGQALFRIEPA